MDIWGLNGVDVKKWRGWLQKTTTLEPKMTTFGGTLRCFRLGRRCFGLVQNGIGPWNPPNKSQHFFDQLKQGCDFCNRPSEKNMLQFSNFQRCMVIGVNDERLAMKGSILIYLWALLMVEIFRTYWTPQTSHGLRAKVAYWGWKMCRCWEVHFKIILEGETCQTPWEMLLSRNLCQLLPLQFLVG